MGLRNILVWATSFGADIWALTHWLSQRGDLDVRVVMQNPERFRREGINQIYPLRAPLHRRTIMSNVAGLAGFRPDITILDNRVPLRSTGGKALVLWHGFGWRGPDDRQQLRVLHEQLRRNFGDPQMANAALRWSCFGPVDFAHRTSVSGFHPDNCRQVGATAHDYLRTPIDRALAAHCYPFDIVRRKTVLFAPTWHYGDVFAHWQEGPSLTCQLLEAVEHMGANLILRMHDSFRYDRKYVHFIRSLQRAHRNVVVKFKDEHPDNIIDMHVADVLVSNYSSVSNLFYATLRPSVHIYPVGDANEQFALRRYTLLGGRSTMIGNANLGVYPPCIRRTNGVCHGA